MADYTVNQITNVENEQTPDTSIISTFKPSGTPSNYTPTANRQTGQYGETEQYEIPPERHLMEQKLIRQKMRDGTL